jgi:hypothetical protein
MATEHETLLGTFKDHTTIVNLWGVFQAVALGLLGFVYAQPGVRTNPWILAGLSVLFIAFAFGNQAALLRSQAVLRAVHDSFHDAEFVKDLPAATCRVLNAHSAQSVEFMRRGHAVTTLAVVVAAWLPLAAGWVSDRIRL